MDAIKLSVRNLVEFVLRCGSIDSRFSGFDRANEGSRIHRKLQKSAGENYHSEVFFRSLRQVDGKSYLLEGRADGVIEENGNYIIDEIKTTTVPTEFLTEDFNPMHWAQAKCYATFLCEEKELENVVIQLTYYQVDTEEIIRYQKTFSRSQLQQFLTQTLRLYAPWAELETTWRQVRNNSLRSLTFPFSDYRPGQYRLARAVYLTICEKGRLFACAPTGIGKTISTLFPALKALGEEQGERIFYLTAKTITRQAAEEALSKMRSHSCNTLRLKTLTLTAKEKICPMEHTECTPEACPFAQGYYDRINDALYQFLTQTDEFTRDSILSFAEQYKLCPFELSLDLSNWCDCIICDYNYLFDPVVSLKRFFSDGGDFIFLVDEAHNLVDRSRNMYSARLCKTDFSKAKKMLGKEASKLKKALLKINRAWLALRQELLDQKERTLLFPDGKKEFAHILPSFSSAAEEWLKDHRTGEGHDTILQLYFDVKFFLKIWDLYDEHFTTLLS
ncbi:DEAD/DEAH box helicase, partial [uncultured Ruthenibacterium sp.]|uniref:DEAD/DEAH box helicase n=1 Tax=uncultured Ruthenibacterium sp. TaxID=1905347 RepID=UPI00349EC905